LGNRIIFSILLFSLIGLFLPPSFALTPAADLTGDWSGFFQFTIIDNNDGTVCEYSGKLNAGVNQDGNGLAVQYTTALTKVSNDDCYWEDDTRRIGGTIDGSRITLSDPFYGELSGWFASSGIKLEAKKHYSYLPGSIPGPPITPGYDLTFKTQLSPTTFTPPPFEQDSKNKVGSIKTNKGSATITTTDGKVVNSNQLESGQTIQTGTDTNVEILLKDESVVITLKENTKLGVYKIIFDPNEKDSYKLLGATEGFSDATGLNAKQIGLIATGFAGGLLLTITGAATPGVLLIGTAFVLVTGALFYATSDSSSEKNQKVIFTPDAVLLPHGTKFTVTVENGQTKLDVLEGEVTVFPLNENNPMRTVKAGNSISISENNVEETSLDTTSIDKWWEVSVQTTPTQPNIPSGGGADNAYDWNNIGYELVTQEKYEEALVAYDNALQYEPNNEWTWASKSNALRGLYEYEEALVAAERAIQIDPLYARGWDSSGMAHYRLENYEEALASFKRTLELDPNQKWPYYWMGHTMQEYKDYEQAMVYYEKALAIDPEFTRAQSALEISEKRRAIMLLYALGLVK